MRAKGKSGEACRQYERLELEQAAGDVPRSRDRAFLAEHLAQCESCRATAAAAALMSHTDDDGPALPLDELSRRRFVSYVVTQAAADGPLEEPKPSSAPVGHPRLLWGAAAVVVLALGVGLVWVLRGSGAHSDGKSPKAPGARLVLRSGEVLVEGASASSELAVGKTLWVRRGQAAVALPDDSCVLLSARSVARVVRLSPGATTLHLEQGWLLASVEPKRRRRRFVVTTRAGRVEVTGTVFTVQVTPDRVTVQVIRGQVKVVESGHPQRLVDRGHWAKMGGPDRAVRSLSTGARRAVMARLASLSMLGVERAAQLDVRSQPAGAEVVMDGVVLGRTPLSARLRAGHHRLGVRMAGRTPVREQLTLRAGDRIGRNYELVRGSVAARSGTPTSRGVGGAGVAAMAPRPVEPVIEEFPPVIIQRSVLRRGGTGQPRPGVPGRGAVTARDLLRRAQKRRAARFWRGAAASYRLLLAKFPASSAARAARVTLGMLLLDHLGAAVGALQLFDAYLRATRRGVLAQEAAYGRIRALRRLGRRAAERRGLESFLKDYPGALQAPLVKARLKGLTGSPAQPQ